MTRLLFLVCLLLLGGCSRPVEPTSSQFLTFGTITEVQIASSDTDAAQVAIASVEADFRRMNDDWHAWKTGPLTFTNDAIASGKPFTAPDSVLDLVKKSLPLELASDHLFNPAIGHLVALWGFHGEDYDSLRPPADSEIHDLVSRNPRLTDLKIEANRVTPENTSVSLDFGAIGKGYGIDLELQKLKDLGIENAVINSGGDLKVIGSKFGSPWRIAIRDPNGKDILGYIDSQGEESYFTSGDYERNFTWKGKRYHHIIDPRDGYPARGSKSVTVIHESALVADAAATALFVAGPQNWRAIARKMRVKFVLLVDDSGRLHMSPEMRNRLQLLEKNHEIIIATSLDSDNTPQTR